MDKKDIAEIKRRLKINKTTITRLAGCYVDEQKEKVTTFTRHFMDLEEDEVHKYLEIANKAFSGTPGNNLLELGFPLEQETEGGLERSLLALRDSKLENDALLDSFYDHVIESYDTVEHYLILLFFDTYDIPLKTTDNMLLDDSEEIYEYIIACICPVKLSKPGLGYLEPENRIAPRIRDWVVSPTESAFVFPCFTERSSDIHHVLCYTKNAGEPHAEFWENGLGAEPKFTSTQKRTGFLGLVAKTVGEANEETPDILLDVQQNIHDYVEQRNEVSADEEPVTLTRDDMTELLEESGIPEGKSERIANSYEEMFPEDSTRAEELFEARALKNNELRREKQLLQEQVVKLNEELEKMGFVNEDGEIIDIVVRTRPDRPLPVDTAFVDGQKCLVIPLQEETTATVNGKEVR